MATVNEKMTALADEIRELSGTTTSKSIDAMRSDVDAANAEIAEQAELLEQITTALEGKTGGIEQITPVITIDPANGLITATAGPKSSTYQLNYKSAQTITPGTNNKTIAANTYLGGTQTIMGDANLISENIVSGKSIFGIKGKAKSFPNGTKWTQSNITDYSIKALLNVDGLWIAAGSGIYYSEDGKVWEQTNMTNTTGVSFYSLSHANGVWIAGAGGGNGIYYSEDGKTWTLSNVNTAYTNYILYANGIWVASCSSEGAWYSTDGKTWAQSNLPGSCNIVYNAHGLWVASSFNNGIFYSTDGKAWAQSNIIEQVVYDIKNANGLWLAIGTSHIYYSTDGKFWTLSQTDSGQELIGSTLIHLWYGNGIWEASGNDGGIYYSEDGKVWSRSNLTLGSFENLYYSNGLWQAINSTNFELAEGLYYSEDGKTWTLSNITNISSSSCVCNANGIWITATGPSGILYYSINGKTWTKASLYGGQVLLNCNGIWVAGGAEIGLQYSIAWEFTT